MATPTLHADTQVGRKRHTTSGWRHGSQKAWWPWLTRGVAIAFFAVSYTHLTLPTSDLV